MKKMIRVTPACAI